MNANKELWEQGDFTRIAETHARQRRGAGEGTRHHQRHAGARPRVRATARPRCPRPASAPRCSRVDIAGNLVAAGNRRAEAAGLTNLRFEVGDASDLFCVSDESFDLVVSVFGAMFAPNPFAVAKEMVRVTRPGGRIVMGNWIPGDPTLVAQLLRISASYSPPPPEGFVSPVTWGVEDERRRALHRRGRAAAAHHLRARHLHVRRAGAAGRVPRATSATTTGRR